METKTCTKCQKDQPVEQFSVRKQKGRTARHSWCEECFTTYKKQYWAKNKEVLSAKKKVWNEKNATKNREQMRCYYANSDKSVWRDKCWESKLKRKFGLTVEDYNRMFEEQNGVCAICGCPESHQHKGRTVRLAVDHCHDTNNVRGLLCRNCNVGIGLLSHCPIKLENAIIYIKKQRSH